MLKSKNMNLSIIIKNRNKCKFIDYGVSYLNKDIFKNYKKKKNSKIYLFIFQHFSKKYVKIFT